MENELIDLVKQKLNLLISKDILSEKWVEVIESAIQIIDHNSNERDCEHCVHHNGKYCTAWDCNFEKKV